jgi:hypothetical protein
MTDERPAGASPEELAIHVVLDGWQLDRKITALAAMASQTGGLMALAGPDLYAAQVAEEAFVDASSLPLVLPLVGAGMPIATEP